MTHRQMLTCRQVLKMSSTGSRISGRGSDDIRRPLDMNELDSEASEFSWGPGLVPKGFESAPVSEGGMYSGLTPDCSPQVRVERR
ncbi:hypothetical protein A5656_12895 [Mycobacterium gordonae]|nr:hypothetical protein A5656_12895 [Mycobacterium gordonae]